MNKAWTCNLPWWWWAQARLMFKIKLNEPILNFYYSAQLDSSTALAVRCSYAYSIKHISLYILFFLFFPGPCGSTTKTWWDACFEPMDTNCFMVWRHVHWASNSDNDYMELWWQGSSCGGIMGWLEDKVPETWCLFFHFLNYICAS